MNDGEMKLSEWYEKLLRDYLRAVELADADGCEFDKYLTEARAEKSPNTDPDNEWLAELPEAVQIARAARLDVRRIEVDFRRLQADHQHLLAQYQKLRGESQKR